MDDGRPLTSFARKMDEKAFASLVHRPSSVVSPPSSLVLRFIYLLQFGKDLFNIFPDELLVRRRPQKVCRMERGHKRYPLIGFPVAAKRSDPFFCLEKRF